MVRFEISDEVAGRQRMRRKEFLCGSVVGLAYGMSARTQKYTPTGELASKMAGEQKTIHFSASLRASPCVLSAALEEVEGVGEKAQDGLEGFEGAARAAGEVDDQRRLSYAHDGSRKCRPRGLL